MNVLFALGLVFVSSAAVAQVHPAASGALGGSYASVGIGRPLGGVAPPASARAGTHRKTASVFPSAFTFYVPNAFDPASASYAPQTSWQGGDQPVQPVVASEYPEPKDQAPENTGSKPATADPQPAANPGGPLEEPRSYYLIAYRDHTVYPALTYWLEGDTLHYVTTRNTHNQASLTLIDLDRTAKLNADLGVPFSIDGK
jgi:hypothetical protein